MKFILSLLVYVLMALILGWGMLLSFRGQHGLLLASLGVYCVAFAKIGCLPSKGHN